jgi:hypothetical protein
MDESQGDPGTGKAWPQATEGGEPIGPSDLLLGGLANPVNRRALLRAGMAATPVLLTLSSSPVSASGTVNCTVASSFVSANTFLSRNANGVTVSCGSKNCEWWQGQCSSPSSSTVSNCLNQTVQACLNAPASCSYQKSKCSALYVGKSIQTSGELGVLQHLVALANNCMAQYLNTAGGAINLSYLQGVCANYYQNGGTYVMPSSKIVWQSTDLIAWLRVMLQYPLAQW